MQPLYLNPNRKWNITIKTPEIDYTNTFTNLITCCTFVEKCNIIQTIQTRYHKYNAYLLTIYTLFKKYIIYDINHIVRQNNDILQTK